MADDRLPVVVCNLHNFMRRHNHKAKFVAERIGMTEANVSKLKNNKTKMVKLETIAKLCRLYKCGIGEMFELDHGEGEEVMTMLDGDFDGLMDELVVKKRILFEKCAVKLLAVAGINISEIHSDREMVDVMKQLKSMGMTIERRLHVPLTPASVDLDDYEKFFVYKPAIGEVPVNGGAHEERLVLLDKKSNRFIAGYKIITTFDGSLVEFMAEPILPEEANHHD